MEGSGSSSRSRSDDRVREWEEGLPSVSEITPLSQCLISPQLASAFSITSDIPPYHTVADVNRASESIVSILRGTSIPVIDMAHHSDTAMASTQKPMQEDRHAQGNPSDNRHGALNSNDNKHGHGDGKPNESSHVRPNYQLSSRNKPTYISAGPAAQSNAENLNSNDEDAACMRDETGLGMAGGADTGRGPSPVPSYSSDAPSRMEADPEPEEVNSPTAANENPNDDSNSRSLKRPRLVWTPELHKRFIEAVDHLGINNAVPKNIMQLMNVDGLTRENVASHLQKYRLYLKRIKQGEGPTSSDHLFVSNNPVAPGYGPSAGYYQGVPSAHMEDVMAMPFPPPHASHLMGRAPIGGPPNAGVPVAPMDPFSYNVFTRPPPPGFMHADPKQMHNQWGLYIHQRV